MSDILDQLNEAALFATNRACTFDGQPDEAGMRDLGYAYGHLHREAFTEIERLRGLLRKIDGILKSGLSASHQRLQIALLIEGAALAGAAGQPAACRHTYREIDPWNRQCVDCGHRVLTCPQCGVERAADNSPASPA